MDFGHEVVVVIIMPTYMYIQVRITADKCEAWQGATGGRHVLSKLMDRYHYEKERILCPTTRKMVRTPGPGCSCSWGFEQANSLGEPTAEHLHFHAYFESLESARGLLSDLGVEAHRKWFRDEMGCSGNKAYSIKLLGDVRDEQIFYGYPLKQHRTLGNQVGVSGDEMDEAYQSLLDHSNGQWTRNMEHKKLALERQTNKNMFWDKLVAALADVYARPGVCDRHIWIGIADYYINQGKTPPWQSLDDKVLHFKVQVGLMDLGEAYCEIHKIDYTPKVTTTTNIEPQKDKPPKRRLKIIS